MSHPYYTLNELREMFLSFFESKGHLRLPSFSLVPQNDKSVLLINAGMTPMKPWFTGEEEPPCRRVTTCQKCIRTGDIENVGKTARHGTYFEMLGNFSFGDYFKEDALKWSWEFLTEVVGLEPDRLYPSVYVDDDEAFRIWNKVIGVPAERISRFGKEDNFWEHGSGPCGPCSEIYYDRGEEYGCGKPDCKVGCDCDRYMEVWNDVFSQFNNDGNNNYTELKQKNIDTGMGLERLAVVVQNVDSLFDTDTVMHITHRVSELTGAYYGQSEKRDVSLRVITDHIRSAVFMICDGVLPSNEGRGYVLRRLLRRAARHGKLLGVNDPFLYQVVETVVQVNEGEYPDVREKQSYITRVVRTEEENFARTIDGGMKIFSDLLDEHKAKGEQVFSGADAFRLYDTFGFPIDLTVEMAADEGLTVDEESFRQLMQEQKERAREARKALGDLGWAGVEFGKDVPATEFVGYSVIQADSRVLAIVADGELRDAVTAGAEAIVVLDQTPFYAEMGGQVADHGTLSGSDMLFEVTDVQKNKGGKYMHYGVLRSGMIRVGDHVEANVDPTRRAAIRRAHSATHLLQAALEKVLGDHVHQAGSLVEPDHLRFDFTHFSAVTPEELKQVRDLMESSILAGYPIETMVLPLEEAKKLGATALFGEKYGDTVRVVKMGKVSLEFCGGTHLSNTAKVGSFRIVSETSIASGVRRIEMVTGREATKLQDRDEEVLARLAEILKAGHGTDLAKRAQQVMDELKESERVIRQYKDRESAGGAADLVKNAEDVSGVHVVTALLTEGDVNALRKLGDALRDKDERIAAVIALVTGGKVTLQAVCGKHAVADGVRAGDIIRAIAPIVGGKGGGKPDSAMGGGSDPSRAAEALAAVKSFVAGKMS
ncbi:MAG: alanine--tRNA ligase [Oscillospiraceae bacterium]|nr:alanine--tRNA ligase [Oscillospiraceae bacterium]